MKNRKAKLIKQDKYAKEWKLYYRIAGFAEELNRLPDAAEIKKDKLKTAPLQLIEMIF
jgi:hypothetical protein